ncbi:MAG: hypothetical protein AVDCRST_MAG34-228 [uncultured Nocardioidaceae bacterium]|uniref:YbdD/YjiX family protein n=1 Tax=uncultured Nocardioidaceae bacterium TaxID=253824 RepID=A0A6J4L869_9ACTN|nr:MAG: hypothetical protein AVDCRST_MAG34-228 [uncultured Nocardioidaceae bacterium]
MKQALVEAARGLRWYLREVTGESRWDAYLDGCRADGVPPMSRREFERHRADRRERCPQSRCC